jgi:NADH-quinone oxidoreductase subunit N
VDARRLRRRADAGDRLLRVRGENGVDGGVRAGLVTAFPGIANDWRQIITFVSIASMGLGAFAAIGQTNFKRLMAYSSIGHMGYALVGSRGRHGGGRPKRRGLHGDLSGDDARDLRRHSVHAAQRPNISRRSPTSQGWGGPIRQMAFFLATMMFSLAGVPPLAGFFAKFYVFAAAIKAGLYGLSVIGVLASVVAAYYYLRIVKLMYFDEPAAAFDRPDPVARIVLAVSAPLIILLFVFLPSPITNAAMAAAQSLF